MAGNELRARAKQRSDTTGRVGIDAICSVLWRLLDGGAGTDLKLYGCHFDKAGRVMWFISLPWWRERNGTYMRDQPCWCAA
jgi:hypothetical protein